MLDTPMSDEVLGRRHAFPSITICTSTNKVAWPIRAATRQRNIMLGYWVFRYIAEAIKAPMVLSLQDV
jgi:hypothetical protein